jgi:beta-glucosidase/6-phospho-beta-glucosidase/beta-galactosidase
MPLNGRTGAGTVPGHHARTVTEATFPQGFLWGAATTGHQVEGNNVNSNYEWFGGYAATFGLIAVGRTTFVRTPKPSLAWLGEVARRNGLG